MSDVIVMMGVTGAGKTAVGRRLAAALSARFVEGDDYHSDANVAKMRRGEALTDEDRGPWLEAIATDMRHWNERQEGAVVLACSALRFRYRELFRSASPAVRFVHLSAARELLRRRTAERTEHFMPSSLLASQLAALEPPTTTEGALTVVVDPSESADDLARHVARVLRQRPRSHRN